MSVESSSKSIGTKYPYARSVRKLRREHQGVFLRFPPQGSAGGRVLARGIRVGLHARCNVHAGHVGMPPQPSSGSPSGVSRLRRSPHFSRLYLDHTSCLPGVQHCCGPACGSGHPRIARLDVPPVVAGASSGLSDKMYSTGSGEGCSGGAPKCLFPALFWGLSWCIFFFLLLFWD